MKILKAKRIDSLDYEVRIIELAKVSPLANRHPEVSEWVRKTIKEDGMLHPIVSMTREIFLQNPVYDSARVLNRQADYFTYVGSNRYFAAIDEEYTHIESYIITNPEKVGKQLRELQVMMQMTEEEYKKIKNEER